MEKIPQPHGGALNRGGTPGNNGGHPRLITPLIRQALAEDDGLRAQQLASSLILNAAKGNGTAIREVLERIDGTVPQKIEYVIPNSEMLRVVGEITARFIEGERFDDWAKMVQDALSDSASQSSADAPEARPETTP